MSVQVQGSIQSISEPLWQLVQASLIESSSCGVILAPCSDVGSSVADQLQAALRKYEPELSAQCGYDVRSQVLCIVLKDQKLAGTHYASLISKEFLERHGLLTGQMLVASFPESGEPSERNLTQLFEAVTTAKRRVKEISLFVEQPPKRNVSSILVADTEEVSRQFLKLRLELKGYEVYEAKDGSEALEMFSQFAPDLVITELNLPILDGYQLIHRIKEELAGRGKVIVLTDKHLTKDLNRAFELGASDYVTKPYSMSELEWRIKKLSTA